MAMSTFGVQNDSRIGHALSPAPLSLYLTPSIYERQGVRDSSEQQSDPATLHPNEA